MNSIALFLGAGFSKPWGLPLARELLPDSEERWVPIINMFERLYQTGLAKNVQKSWLQYLNECEDRVNVSVDVFARDLQRDDQGVMGLSYKDLARFLALQLAVKQSDIRYFYGSPQYTRHHIRKQRTIPSCYRELMKVLKKYSLRGIVTTNYDLVVEKILGPGTKEKSGGFNYGQQGEAAFGTHQLSYRHRYGQINLDGAIPLLKLHGSLNWAESDERDTGKRDIDVWVDCRPSLSQKKYRPLIVPPHDSSHDEILRKVWLKASEVLRGADVWVFCGYSLPDYDNEVGNLLKSSAYNLRRVVILNPDAIVEKKIRDLLNAPVPELEVKRGPRLGDEQLTELKLRSLISGN